MVLYDKGEFLIVEKNFAEALPLLQEANRLAPDTLAILQSLGMVQSMLGMHSACYITMERLVELQPDELIGWMAWAETASESQLPMTSFYAAQEVTRRFAPSPDRLVAEQIVERGWPTIEQNLNSANFEGCPTDPTEKLALMVRYEKAMARFQSSDFSGTARRLESLLADFPNFFRVRNTLATAQFQSGQRDKALATIEQVLQDHPDNHFALNLRAEFLLQSGRIEEAQAALDDSLRLEPTESEHWHGLAKLVACLRDESEVIALGGRAKEHDMFVRGAMRELAILPHVEGVAHARLGGLEAARECWQTGYRVSPKFDMSRRNEDDLKLLPGQRHGLWYLPIEMWIPDAGNELFAAVANTYDPNHGLGWPPLAPQDEQRLTHLMPLVPLMLERGCEDSWDFAVAWLFRQGTPESIELARQAAQGSRAIDKERHYLMEALCQAGQLPAGEYEAWSGGQPVKRTYGSIKIQYKAEKAGYLPRQQRILDEGFTVLSEGQFEEGERLFRLGIKAGVDDAPTWFNLAAALVHQGKSSQAEEILAEVRRRWPEYSFARIMAASEALNKGRNDEAQSYLEPIYQKTIMHITEYRAWCQIQIQFAAAERDAGKWQAWYEALLRADPGLAQKVPVPAFIKSAQRVRGALSKMD